MGAWLALSLLIVAGLILVLQHDAGTIAGLQTDNFAAVAAMAALLIYLSGSLFAGYRGRGARAFRDAVTWAGMGLLLISLYSLRDEFEPLVARITGELVPGAPIAVQTEPGTAPSVRIRRHGDGQFVARTLVNGAAITMMVDTGAASVVLNSSDAQRMGIDTSRLSYSVPVLTANGTSRAARIRLNMISIGPLAVSNVDALVAPPGSLHQSLLGMSFLSRLRSYEFSGDFLTLRG